MKALYQIFLLFTITILVSCGQSNEELKIAEKSKLDSVTIAVRKATEDSIKLSVKLQELKTQKEIASGAVRFFEASIRELKGKQTTVEIEMENIKSFQFGRTSDEKQQQITDKLLKKKSIDEQIETMNGALKIFRKANKLMEDLNNKKFNTYLDFENYRKELFDRIHSIELDVIEDNNNERLSKFNFETIINDKSFIKAVEQANTNFAMVDSIGSN